MRDGVRRAPEGRRRAGCGQHHRRCGGKPFILFRRAVVIDAALRELTRQMGFEPNVVMENDEPDSIKKL